jgi:arylsulfatase A-like enzyme
MVKPGKEKGRAEGQGSGEVCSRPVGLIDLYPTLLDLCGLPANSMNEGRSIVPLIDDPDAVWNTPTITTYGRNNHAVQTQRYRFYRYEDGSMELYDHRRDPNEWQNIAMDPTRSELVKQLASELPKINAEPSKYNKYPTNEYFLTK